MIISRPVGHYSNLPTVEIDILKASVFIRNYFGSILCAHIVGRDRAFATARVHSHSHKIENMYTYIWDLTWKVGNSRLAQSQHCDTIQYWFTATTGKLPQSPKGLFLQRPREVSLGPFLQTPTASADETTSVTEQSPLWKSTLLEARFTAVYLDLPCPHALRLPH